MSYIPMQKSSAVLEDGSTFEWEWPLPNIPNRCTYHLGGPSVHQHNSRKPRPKIFPNIMAVTGDTPLVKLNKIPQTFGIQCDILAKCEYFNPGGSVKERIALRMIEDAEKAGKIKPGDTIIEPSSGNTGIGLALASAVKGYKCIIVMPDKMSMEKEDTLRAFGAEVVRTPAAAYTSPLSTVAEAYKIKAQTPNSHVLNQYRNPSNPLAHYDGTAEEILDACDRKVDMVVLGAGTGGTISGIGRKVKEVCPDAKVIALDPYGSIIAEPEEINKSPVKKFEVEGIGHDYVPTNLDRSIVDKWYKCQDKASFDIARRMVAEEGIMCGGSSGSAVLSALYACQDFNLKPGQKCVVLLPDSTRNYLTRYANDNWMGERGYLDNEPKQWWSDLPLNNLPLRAAPTVNVSDSLDNAIQQLETEGMQEIVAINDTGDLVGMVTYTHMIKLITRGRLSLKDTVQRALLKGFKQVASDFTLGKLSHSLSQEQFVVVNDFSPKGQQNGAVSNGNGHTQSSYAVVTCADLLKFIRKSQK